MSVENKETKHILLNLENLLQYAIANIHKEQAALDNSNQTGGAKKKRKKRVKITKSDTQETCEALIELFKSSKEVIEKESEKYQRILKCMSNKNRRQFEGKDGNKFDHFHQCE